MATNQREMVIPAEDKVTVVAKGVDRVLPPLLNATTIATDLVAYAAEAEKAVEAATRIEVKDQASFDVATDVGGSIALVLRNLETTRKSYTTPIENAKKKLIALFAGPGDRLQSSLDAIKRKMTTYRVAEEARRRQEAAAEQARIAAEAKELADAAAAMGDAEGAKNIIADAAAIVVEPEKVTGAGSFGVSTAVRKLPTGEVVDKTAFLRWLIENPVMGAPALAELEFGKRGLNALAKNMLEANAPAHAVPGFEFTYTESTGFRS